METENSGKEVGYLGLRTAHAKFLYIQSSSLWQRACTRIPCLCENFSCYVSTSFFGLSRVINGANIKSGHGGSAYFFERRDNTWIEVAKCDSSSDNDGNIVCHYVSGLAMNNMFALVGNPGDGTGAVYVIERQNGSWNEVAVLRADDGIIEAEFGCSVSIDGAYAIIGAPSDASNHPGTGSAYIFARQDTGWVQTAN